MSATEWMPSDSIAELPVTAAAPNLATAMIALAIIAATTALVLPEAMSNPPR